MERLNILDCINRYIRDKTILWQASASASSDLSWSPERSATVGGLITWIHWHNFLLRSRDSESSHGGGGGREFRPGIHKEELADAIDELDALMGSACGDEAAGGETFGSLIDMVSSTDLEIFDLIRSDGWRDVDRLNTLLDRYYSLKANVVAMAAVRDQARPDEARAGSSSSPAMCLAEEGQPFDYLLD
ncbi:MAG: hypothetical protein NVSMB9_10640 [Isosphaeraceae bacterium]